MAEEEEDAGTPRRDPSEKQEPHTVMWGKNMFRQLHKIRLKPIKLAQLHMVFCCPCLSYLEKINRCLRSPKFKAC